MIKRTAFAGGDQEYLRNVQYGDGSKLDVRIALHQRFSTYRLAFPDFVAGLIGPREWSRDPPIVRDPAGSRLWRATSAMCNTCVLRPDGILLAATNGYGHIREMAQAAEFASAIERRFENGQLRIRTRTGAFVCRRHRDGP